MKTFILLSGIVFAIASDSQADILRRVSSIAELRAGDFGNTQSLALIGFYSGSPIGGGTLAATRDGADDGCLVYADKAGHLFRRDLSGQPLDVSQCGARCGGVQVSDAHSTAGSPVITSATARWTPLMVGWRAVVNRAGPSGKQIDTTVAAVDSTGSLRLAAAAAAAGSGETVAVYPDDTAALDAAFAAAGKAGIAVQISAGAVCGYANPGASVIKTVTARGLLLNSGTLWLAHTGPARDTGVGLRFAADGAFIRGPGVISGLYQTDQNEGQYNTTAILFQGTSGNSISGHITIENTKGRAFHGLEVKDFSITDVTAQACGDFAFHPPAGMDIMTGRSMCGEVTKPRGTLVVKNYTARDAAQSGFLIYGPTDPAFHASFSGCHFRGNGYYGLDLEEISGTVAVSDCEQTGNGQPAPAGLVYGGYQMRDVARFYASNIRSSLTDSNAFVLQSVDKPNLQEWTIEGLSLTGTPAGHGAGLYLAFSYFGKPQRVFLSNVAYDNLTMYANGAHCGLPPREQILSFDNMRASGLYKGIQTELDFQGNPGQQTYVQGRNSDLGTVAVKFLAGNQNAVNFDLAKVRTKGSLPESIHC